MGYCPLLETLSVSYCSVNEVGPMSGCPSLSEIDLSFNHIPSLKTLVNCLPHWNLTTLKFNDNLFSAISHDEAFYARADQTSTLQQYPDQYLKMIKLKFPNLKSFNKDEIEADTNRNPPIDSLILYRRFINKLLSQRIRVTYLN
jgi:Leucine-rich repeat (LRR) protein